MGRLQLRQEPSGPRHYLDGEPVHAGQVLELALHEGAAVFDWHGRLQRPDAPFPPNPEPVWLRGRYEWSYQPGELPRFFLELGNGKTPGAGECVALAELRLPAAAILRWPRRG